MMPIVVVALGTILQKLKENQRTIGVDASIELIPKYSVICRKYWQYVVN